MIKIKNSDKCYIEIQVWLLGLYAWSPVCPSALSTDSFSSLSLKFSYFVAFDEHILNLFWIILILRVSSEPIYCHTAV